MMEVLQSEYGSMVSAMSVLPWFTCASTGTA